MKSPFAVELYSGMKNADMDSIFLSIIIANFNYGRFLKDAIESVLTQSCQDFELIVVDGGSTDNSYQIIEQYSQMLNGERFFGNNKGKKIPYEKNKRNPPFFWCSEKDSGQSHAINKGFEHARGKFLTWLNADDVMFPCTIERLKNASLKNPECEWLVGGCFWLNPELKVIKCSRPRPFSVLRAKNHEIGVWAPSSFFSKALFVKVGGLDNDFHFMMDTELWYKFYKVAGVKYKTIKAYAFGLRLHPEAKMSGHNFEESDQKNPLHPKWKQLSTEQSLFENRYGKISSKWYIKWISTPVIIKMNNIFDTWRIKNKHYSQFKF